MAYQKEANSTSDILSIQFSRFEKEKREFSSLAPAGDFVSTYGQFNVPPRIKSDIKIREASYFIITAPALFA
jgi:hypothetical protein